MNKRILKAKQQRTENCYIIQNGDKNSITSELCSSNIGKIVVFTIHYNNEKYLNAKIKVMENYSIQRAW